MALALMMTATAFVAFLMAALVTLAVMMSTFVALTVMVTALVALAVMVVVVAAGVRVIGQIPLSQSFGRRVGGTLDPSVEPDAGVRESHLGPHADAAAD